MSVLEPEQSLVLYLAVAVSTLRDFEPVFSEMFNT